MSFRKSEVVSRELSKFLVDLPSPSSLSYMWNFGSLLGVFLLFQIFTGLFLSIHFSVDVELSFSSVVHIMRDVNWGWIIRIFHSNGASMFFMMTYFHIGRGIYYGSYRLWKTWMVGVTIFLLAMVTAFLGYVLPWGQMSFWAATVITNLMSAIPYVGKMMVEWVWGGFAVSNPTLTRFFVFHFIFPFVIVFLVLIHLIYLHEVGSSNPLGINSSVDKISFHFLFNVSDVYGIFLSIFMLVLMSLLTPFIFMDCENFIPSNPLVTPVHIQPEWYFLYAYSILRSVASKIGGVVALMMSVFVLYLFPLVMNHKIQSLSFYVLGKFVFWYLVVVWMMLTWLGSCEVELPYSDVSGVFSFMYFLLFVLMWIGCKIQDMLSWF